MNLTTLGILSAAGAGAAGANYWISLAGISGVTTVSNESAVDSENNIIVVGRTTESSVEVATVIKYSPSGSVIFQRKYSSFTDFERVAVDTSNNIYVTGSTGDGTTFGWVIVKLNSSGVIQWQRRLGVASVEAGRANQGRGIAVDSDGNVLVTGRGWRSSSESGIGISKYNNSGTLQWVRNLYTSGNSRFGISIGSDSSNNVYVAGQGSNTMWLAQYNASGTLQSQQRYRLDPDGDLNPEKMIIDSSGNGYLASNGANNRAYMAKANSSGSLTLMRRLAPSANALNALGIATDTSGNIYLAGRRTSSPFRGLIFKYDSSGTLQWQRELFHSSGTEFGSIKVDGQGNLIVSGFTTAGNLQSIVVKLPADGSLTGTYTVGAYTYTYAASSHTDGSYAVQTASDPALTAETWSATDSGISLSEANVSTTQTIGEIS